MASFENPRDTNLYLALHGSHLSYRKYVDSISTPHIKEYFQGFLNPQKMATLERFVEVKKKIYIKNKNFFEWIALSLPSLVCSNLRVD